VDSRNVIKFQKKKCSNATEHPDSQSDAALSLRQSSDKLNGSKIIEHNAEYYKQLKTKYSGIGSKIDCW
jgi:hypothetical protein